MWTVLLLVIFGFGGMYALSRFRNWSKWKIGEEGKITEEKMLDEWVALINKAPHQADKMMDKLAREIQAEKIPNITITKKEIKLGRDPRRMIVIEHSFLKGYYMYVAALAYGEDRLNIVWYLVLDTPEIAAARRDAKYGHNTNAPGHAFFNTVFTGGFNRVLNMSILDKLELSNYVGLVHRVVVDETKKLMEELNLDFSQVNTHTKGFLNLS